MPVKPLPRPATKPRGRALPAYTHNHDDEITMNRSVEPADGLGSVLFPAWRSEQAVLETTPAGPAPARAMLAAAGQPSASRDAAKAPVR